MSLINQMLKDLEARRSLEHSRMPSAAAVVVASANASRSGHRSVHRLGLAAALLLLVAVGGVALWWLAPRQVTVVEHHALPVLEGAGASTNPPLAAARVPQLLTVALTEQQESARLVLEFSAALECQPFLDVAARQLHVRWPAASAAVFPSPLPNAQQQMVNAVEWQVVSTAQSGAAQQQVTLHLAQPATFTAFSLPADHGHGWRLVVSVAAQHPEALVAPANSAANSPAKVSVHAMAAPVVDDVPPPRTAAADAAVAPQFAAPPATAIRAVAPAIAITAQQRSRQLLHEAQLQRAARRYAAAASLLQQAVQHDVENSDAWYELAAVYLESGQLTQAAEIAEKGGQHHPQHVGLMTLQARLLLEQNAPQRALVLLHKVSAPALPAGSDYYALLAALQQQTGAVDAARQTYSLLTDCDRQRGDWWLGRAICEQQLGQHAAAAQSYQQALLSPGLQAPLRAYARQQLLHLAKG